MDVHLPFSDLAIEPSTLTLSQLARYSLAIAHSAHATGYSHCRRTEMGSTLVLPLEIWNIVAKVVHPDDLANLGLVSK